MAGPKKQRSERGEIEAENEFWTTLSGCVSRVIKSGEGQAAHTLLPQRGTGAGIQAAED